MDGDRYDAGDAVHVRLKHTCKIRQEKSCLPDLPSTRLSRCQLEGSVKTAFESVCAVYASLHARGLVGSDGNFESDPEEPLGSGTPKKDIQQATTRQSEPPGRRDAI